MTAIHFAAYADPFRIVSVLCDSLRLSVDRTYTYPVLWVWTDISQYTTFEREDILTAIEQHINDDNGPYS